MPVIRGRFTASLLTPERRAHLKERLVSELSGQRTPDGPLIFEIPLEQSDKFDVIVIWNEFEGLRAGDRDQIILEVYGDRRQQISMVMGATQREADDQSLLPYSVFSKVMVIADNSLPVNPKNLDELREAMLDEGGVVLDDGDVALRFPTRAMAEEAQERLAERLPRGKWSISKTLDSIP
jgi:hypothetical protein